MPFRIFRRAATVLGALGLLLFAAGCAEDHEKIVFGDESEVHAAIKTSSLPPMPTKKQLEKADLVRIEQVVFGFLVEGHFWEAGDYSAIFLQADDVQVNALIRQYPKHDPPLKPGYHALIQAHRTPVDKDTYRSAMILSVDVGELNDDDSVDAIGRWYAGDAVTGFHTFHLVKSGDKWQVTDVK